MLKQIVTAVIFTCLVAIACSAAVIGYFAVGLSVRESIIVAIGALAVLVCLQVFLTLNRRLGELEDDIASADRRIVRTSTELEKLISHSDALDEGLRNMMNDGDASLKTDIQALIGITRKLAERTARLEAAFVQSQTQRQKARQALEAAAQDARNAAVSDNQRSERSSANEEDQATVIDDLPASPKPGEEPKRLVSRADEYRKRRDQISQLGDRHVAQVLEACLQDNRIDVHLQAVMTLPARRASSYEALVRFKDVDGTLITAAEALPVARSIGVMSELDLRMLIRVIAVAGRLAERRSSTPISMNLSPDMLVDGKRFSQFFNLLEANRALAETIVLEVRQDDYAQFGPLEHESLAAIASLGFELTLDFAVRRDMQPRDLSQRGFRSVKMPVEILTAEDEIAGLDIHPQDLADYARRHGLTLIATDVERESEVVAALEYGVKQAQGHLFAEAKPVRADLLEPSSTLQLETNPLRSLRRTA
ncbi:MAG: EAL domain-containing protein [Pseudomonadota bacterium]